MLTYFVQGAKVNHGVPVTMREDGMFFVGSAANPIFLNDRAITKARWQGRSITADNLWALKRGDKVILGVPNGHADDGGILVLWHLTYAKGQHLRQMYCRYADVLHIAEYETDNGAGAYVLLALYPDGTVTYYRSPEKLAHLLYGKAGLQSKMLEAPVKHAA